MVIDGKQRTTFWAPITMAVDVVPSLKNILAASPTSFALKDHRPQNLWLSDWQLFQLPVNHICSILPSTVCMFFADELLDEI